MEDWYLADDFPRLIFEDHHSGGQITSRRIEENWLADYNRSDFWASANQSSQNHVTNQNSENQLIMDGITNVFSAAGSSGVRAEDTSILVRTNPDGLDSGVEAEGRTVRMAGHQTCQNQSVLRAQNSVHIGTSNDVEPVTDRFEKKRRKDKDEKKNRTDREYRARMKESKKKMEEDLQSANTCISQQHKKIQKLEQDLQASFRRNDSLSENLVAANTMIEQLERNCQHLSQTLADRKKAEEEVLVKLQSANATIEKLRLKGQQSVSQQPVKAVLRLDIKDDRGKQKVMEIVSSFPGTDSIAISVAEKKLTIIGDVDPVDIVRKLRKVYDTHILSVGPAKEEKKFDEKKCEEKRPCAAPRILDDYKKKESDVVGELVRSYKAYNPYTVQYYYPYYSVEENPNSCVIC